MRQCILCVVQDATESCTHALAEMMDCADIISRAEMSPRAAELFTMAQVEKICLEDQGPGWDGRIWHTFVICYLVHPHVALQIRESKSLGGFCMRHLELKVEPIACITGPR